MIHDWGSPYVYLAPATADDSRRAYGSCASWLPTTTTACKLMLMSIYSLAWLTVLRLRLEVYAIITALWSRVTAMSEQIWEGIVETDRLIRYFHKLSVKHRKRHQITAWGLAVFATGSAGTMIARLPEWSSAILFLIVACVAIASLMLNDSAKSTAARMIADQFQLLGREWRQLWYGECTQEQIETLWAKFYHIPAGVDIG